MDNQDHVVKLSKLESEVHSIDATVAKLFEKFDDFVEKTQPKPMTISSIVGILASILAIFALLFGSVIYISNSSNAPMAQQSTQILNSLASINSNMMKNLSLIQLTNKEVSVIATKSKENESTLQWLIFEENLPKQLTSMQGDIKTLQEKAHIHISTADTKMKGVNNAIH